jgi:FkbM family methyltransferase
MGLVSAGLDDPRWQDGTPQIMRGKLHGLLLELDLRTWSDRLTWFLGRYYDLGTQLLVGGLLEAGDVFVDIGANEGMISLVASLSVGQQGKVIAFEPNPLPRGIFERNLALNQISNVEVIAAGAGETAGTLDLYVANINSGGGSFALAGKGEAGLDVVQCPIVVADEVLAPVSPRVIKIDVEGFEPFVLKGLAQTIARARPAITIEMVGKHLARVDTTPQQLCRTIADHGYVGYLTTLSGPSTDQRLSFAKIDPAHWRDGDALWLPEECAEAELKRVRNFGARDLQEKWRSAR